MLRSIKFSDCPEWLRESILEEDLKRVLNMNEEELMSKILHSSLVRMIIKFFEDFPRLDLKLQEKLFDSIYINFLDTKLNTAIILNNDEADIPNYVKEEFKRRFS